MKNGKRYKEETEDKSKIKKKPKKYINIKLIFIRFIQLVLIATIVWSLSYIIKWLKENKENSKIKSQIDEAVTIDNNNNYNIDFEKLSNTNSDVVAWLRVNNTNIEYPVVQAKNNEYYLYHSFNKTENGAGWIFADYRNKLDKTDKNIVIYGHNRKDKSMFGTLNKVLEKEWYENEENRKIVLITPEEKCNYEIFSVYKVPNEDYYISTNFRDETEFKSFINNIKSRSVYNFKTEVDENSQILTLSTCGTTSKYRVAVHAVLISQ